MQVMARITGLVAMFLGNSRRSEWFTSVVVGLWTKAWPYPAGLNRIGQMAMPIVRFGSKEPADCAHRGSQIRLILC